MKKIGRLKVTISVAALYLLTQIPRLLPDASWNVHYVIVGLAVVVSGCVEWFRSAPVLRIQDRRRVFFDQVCKDALEELREHDPTARLNIMEIDGLLPFKLFRSLKIIYDLHVKKEDPDRGMKMKIWQGVAGQAAVSGEFCYGDISDKERGPRFNLNAKQQEKTSHVRLVLSMPIKKVVQGGRDEPEVSDKVIGVVNIDSQREDAFNYYQTLMVDYESLMYRQEQALKGISGYCSYVMS